MKRSGWFGGWLVGGCVWYTVLSALFLFANLLVDSSSSAKTVSIGSFLLLLPCALCVSAAGVLQKVDRIPRYLRWILHYVITVAAIYLFIWLPSRNAMTPVNALLTLVLFTVIYWALFLLVQLIRNRIRKLMDEEDK